MIKNGQNKTRIKAGIECIVPTPTRYISLAAAIVYVTNDVTIPVNSMTSQMNTIVTQGSFLSNALPWTFDIGVGDIKSNQMKSFH